MTEIITFVNLCMEKFPYGFNKALLFIYPTLIILLLLRRIQGKEAVPPLIKFLFKNLHIPLNRNQHETTQKILQDHSNFDTKTCFKKLIVYEFDEINNALVENSDQFYANFKTYIEHHRKSKEPITFDFSRITSVNGKFVFAWQKLFLDILNDNNIIVHFIFNRQFEQLNILYTEIQEKIAKYGRTSLTIEVR